MIKLLAFALYVVIGVIIGSAFYKFYGQRTLALPLCWVVGILGAFGGLLISDLADVHLIGNVLDSIMFASAGSAALLLLNLIARKAR